MALYILFLLFCVAEIPKIEKVNRGFTEKKKNNQLILHTKLIDRQKKKQWIRRFN